MSLIVFVVALLRFCSPKGIIDLLLSTRSMSLVSFPDPHGIHLENLVPVLGSFITCPFVVACGSLYDRISQGARLLQPTIELLVGIPSVVTSLLGLQVVVPFVRSAGGTGFRILSIFLSSLSWFFFLTFYDNRQLTGSASSLSGSELAMGATRWQTIWLSP